MKTSGALPVWWFLQNNVRRVICLVLLFIALSELAALFWKLGDWHHLKALCCYMSRLDAVQVVPLCGDSSCMQLAGPMQFCGIRSWSCMATRSAWPRDADRSAWFCATASHAASRLPCASCEPAWGPITAQQWSIMPECSRAW